MTVRRIFDAYREPDKQKKSALKAELNNAYVLEDVTIKYGGSLGHCGGSGNSRHFLQSVEPKKSVFSDTASIRLRRARLGHAVSIDERRAQFKSTLWTQPGRAAFAQTMRKSEQVWFAGVPLGRWGRLPGM